MKRFVVSCCAMILGFTGIILADEKDLKDLDGTYSIVSMQKGGESAKKDLLQKVKATFKGDSLTLLVDDEGKKEEKKAKIKTDATKQPHTIDITPAEGTGVTFLGIYKIEKDDLTIAYTEKQGDRPKDFKSDEGVLLMKLKKDEKK
jgi:uncharacterized protein (TIGR03067 family)